MKKLCRATVLSAVLACFISLGSLRGQSGIFDRTGIIPGRGSYSSLPEESVDLFSGNLTLGYRDIFLPGRNGLNIEVWRVYNSKILQDKLASQQNPTVQAYPKSTVGIGWTMHMGMVHNLSSDTPIIEFPDGRRETAFPPKTGPSGYGWTSNYRITKDFLKFDKGIPPANPKLYFPDGVVWTFGNIASLPLANGSSETVYMVTHIEDPQGNYIDIEYDPVDNLRSIKTITDSMDREVRFISTSHGSDPRTLAEIRIRNHNDTHDVVHSYAVGSFPNGFYRLESYTPPELPSTTFEYNNGQSNNYELTRMTSSYGGVLEYSYENHNFYLNATQLDSKVVSQKRITFDPGADTQVWNYTYPTYQGVSSGTASVQGPEYSTEITSYAYNSQNPWRMGLEIARAVGDGSSSSSYSWTYHEVSDTSWSSFGVSMGKARGPLASSSTTSLTGDATLRQDFLYLRDSVKKFGLPTRVSIFVNGSPTAKSYSELTYFWESHSSFQDRYMLSFIDNEKAKSGAGLLLKETISTYFEESGKWGALKQVQRLKAPSVYYTWDYTHESPNPHYVTTTIDGPGQGGISTVSFDYGLERDASAPTYLKFRRWISKYSAVIFERNQFGGSKGYAYDDLGRVTSLTLRNEWDDNCDPPQDPPDPFLTVGYDWRPDGRNEVVITNGGSTITKYWDGMGRDTGYMETGDGTTLYSRKTLDAEGRVKNENRGSTSTDHKYSYLYDNAGRITRVTDPVSEPTEVSYSARTRTLTDPEGHSTVYDYNDLPGQPTRLTDAQGHIANYTYDSIGRLTQVVYNAARTQTYQYDGLDNVTREVHPETGTIDYIYNPENKLGQKNWGGASYFYSYSTGQLTALVGAETVTYGYNDEGAVSGVTGSTGWSRTGIEYNDFGAVTQETISTPGLASKSIFYEYDANGNLTKTTYPDGKEAVLAFNDLGRPESLTFNANTIVNSAAYGPNKMPASIVAGNGTVMSSTFYNNGTPNTVSLIKGSTPLSYATYAYDGAGNITGISSTAPAPVLNATFAYDSLNRLTSATYSAGDPGTPGTYGYEYDAYGNMLTVRHNGSTIAFDENYDSQNRIDDINFQYDARGNLTSKEGKNYFWDAQNRLRAVTDVSGQFMAEYAYDDRGLRIATLAPKPDIDIVGFADGANADFVSGLQTPATRPSRSSIAATGT